MKKYIEVPELARVEGEGGLTIWVDDGEIKDINLRIFEPPRFFEGFLQGRFLQEVPDITARICGICPVAYQMSSVRALEAALGITVSKDTRDLRDLFYCGEFIESHILHVFMLQAPDITGHQSAIELAGDNPQVVTDALRMKKIGNDILKAVGGRSVHPVNACVGGFYSFPDKSKFTALLPDLEWGLEKAIAYLKWAATLPYPDLEIDDYEYVSLVNPDQYAILDGDIISSKNGVIKETDFEKHYLEKHVKHSNALHSHTKDGDIYIVGPLARYNNNAESLLSFVKELITELGVEPPITNPYKQLITRMVEVVEVYQRAIDLINAYDPKGEAHLTLDLKAGIGAAASEAPRGLLYHRYNIDDHGMIEQARIVPPTAQNLARIESDLWKLTPQVMDMTNEEATLECEHLIRSYDPCISCATHFLKLDIKQVEK